VLTKLCIIYYSLSFSFLGFSFPFPCQMNVPDLAPNLFEMKEKNQTNGKSPNLWPFVLLGSLSLSSAHFRPLPSVLGPPPPGGGGGGGGGAGSELLHKASWSPLPLALPFAAVWAPAAAGSRSVHQRTSTAFSPVGQY
jgi:hypothetical protein